MNGADGITMMFCVHGGEEIGGGFVVGLLLLAAPMHEEAVAEPAKHPNDVHGMGRPDEVSKPLTSYPERIVRWRFVGSIAFSEYTVSMVFRSLFGSVKVICPRAALFPLNQGGSRGKSNTSKRPFASVSSQAK